MAPLDIKVAICHDPPTCSKSAIPEIVVWHDSQVSPKMATLEIKVAIGHDPQVSAKVPPLDLLSRSSRTIFACGNENSDFVPGPRADLVVCLNHNGILRVLLQMVQA